MITQISSSFLQLMESLGNETYDILYENRSFRFHFSVIIVQREFCLKTTFKNEAIIQRLLPNYSINQEDKKNIKIEADNNGNIISNIPLSIGKFQININYKEYEDSSIHISTLIKLKATIAHIYNNPERDVFCYSSKKEELKTLVLQFEQKNGNTGHCFVDFGTGSIFYQQDLGALLGLSQLSEISLMDTVKVEWPALGFKTPHISMPLKQNQEYVIHQSFLKISTHSFPSVYEASTAHLKFLKEIFPKLIKPKKKIANILDYAYRSLHDLKNYYGCWKQVKNQTYLTAYLNDYSTPPESTGQLALLKPLYMFQQKFPNGDCQKILELLKNNIAEFFDPALGTFHRWLPAETHLLDRQEEQMHSFVIDSWYLLYPILQLAFLFEEGFKDERLENQFQTSLKYIQKAAQHFEYQWPIFFNIFTLEVIKTKASENQFGEIDTSGLYILIMLKSYKLLKKEVYLREAKKAAQKIKNPDFHALYQSNNTAYTAESLLELFIIEGNKNYLHAAEIYLGNVLRNCTIWDMKYGNAAERETFMSLLPLKETVYSAAFEEHETLAIFHRINHMVYKQKIALNSNLLFLLNEYLQYAILRFPYYLPPLLAEDILANSCKTGFVNPAVWIPIEDMGDGWEAVAQVGQEVYGAGLFFNLCNFHVFELGEESYVFTTLPFIQHKNKRMEITILGSESQKGLIRIISKQKEVKVVINGVQQKTKNKYTIQSKDNITFALN